MIIVTGGSGFIGTNLIEHLHRSYPRRDILNLDKHTSISNTHLMDRYGCSKWYSEIECDIISPTHAIDCLAKYKTIDCIIHLAAESHVDRSCEDMSPFVETNVLGTSIIATHAAKNNIPFVNMSTDEVYGSTYGDIDAFNEEDPLLPTNPYAVSKTCADLLVSSLMQQHPKWDAVTLRCVNNFGRHQDKTKFIPKAISELLLGNKIPLYGDGNFVRSWIHVDHACDIIISIIQRVCAGELNHKIYNIGSPVVCSNLDIAKELCRLCDVSEEDGISFIADPRGVAHDRRYNVDHERILSELKINREVNFVFENELQKLVGEMTNGKS